MILDVACGAHPYGDVNVDIGPLVRASDSGLYTRANVYASVYDLPFKDDSFEVVHFVGLLHHLERPEDAWDEMVRVAKDLIVGEEPSVTNPRAHMDPHHVFHGFRPSALRRICDRGVAVLRMGFFFPDVARDPTMQSWSLLAFKRRPCLLKGGRALL